MANRPSLATTTCTTIQSANGFRSTFVFNVEGRELNLPELEQELSSFLDMDERIDFVNALIMHPDKFIQLS